MTRRRQAFLAVLLLGMMALAGCGAGGKAPEFAFPSGPFTNADLNGAYVFSISGSNSFGFFTAAGTFQADGHGNVSTAVFDVNSGNGVFTNVSASGIYAMSPDGRGNLTLNSQLTQLDLDFVLTSGQHGLMIRFDTMATASGTLDRQDPTALSTAAVHGPYVFNLSGIDSSGGILVNAGVLSADGAGSITGGVADENDNGVASTELAVSGAYMVGAGGRGVLQLITDQVVWNFAFYIVDATHLKLVQTDTSMALGGEVFSQQGQISNATLIGGYAFTVGGLSTSGPYANGGIFTADGNGNITSGVQDVNDSGLVTQNTAITGQYALAGNGRGTITLTGSTITTNFAIYPSSGGLQMVQLDSTTVTNGAAFSQVGTMLSTPGVVNTYAYNMTGAMNGGSMDSIAQFTADGKGAVSGAIDYNLGGALSFGLNLKGTYSVAENGRGNLILRNTTANQNLAIYMANSRVLVLDLDRALIGIGAFEPQSNVRVAAER